MSCHTRLHNVYPKQLVPLVRPKVDCGDPNCWICKYGWDEGMRRVASLAVAKVDREVKEALEQIRGSL